MIPTNRDIQEFLFGTGMMLAGWGLGSFAPLPSWLGWAAMVGGIAAACLGTLGFMRTVLRAR